MNAKQAVLLAHDSAPPPASEARATGERELFEQESAEAFKIVVTLREAIEAADSVERRLEGTSDPRYAVFLSKARDRHLQIAENARRLLVDMIVAVSGGAPVAKRRTGVFAKRSS
jgi:hypothetical protein